MAVQASRTSAGRPFAGCSGLYPPVACRPFPARGEQLVARREHAERLVTRQHGHGGGSPNRIGTLRQHLPPVEDPDWSTFAQVTNEAVDYRLVDGSTANPQAFIVHGLALTLMGLVARLAVSGHLETLRALDHVSLISFQSIGTNWAPHFELVIEADDETWGKISTETEQMQEHLAEISAVSWTVRRSQVLVIKDDYGQPVALSREGVSEALNRVGKTDAALLALRATGFQVRPRPTGGGHIVTVSDPDQLGSDEVARLDEALFRSFPRQTTWATAPGFQQLVRRLAPTPPDHHRPRIAVVTSASSAIKADTLPHLEVFELTTSTVWVSAPDAATRLATELTQLGTPPRRYDAVLIARGGGSHVELLRLATPEVRAAIERLRLLGTYVVAAFGHGDFHANVGADVHAKTPTSGALIVRRKFHDAPEAQRMAYANHTAQVERLVFDGRDDPSELARNLFHALNAIDQQTNDLIDQHRQQEAPAF